MKATLLFAIVIPLTLLTGATAPKIRRKEDLSTPAKRMSSELSDQAKTALIGGHYVAALAAADAAKALEPDAAWPRYDRAVALVHLDRLDEALAEYKAAETRFGPKDTRDRSVAIYGRAHALAEKGRCEEAGRAFDEYAVTVKVTDPPSATLALAMKAACVQRPVASIQPPVKGSAVAEAREAAQIAGAAEHWAKREEDGVVGDPARFSLLEQVRARSRKLDQIASRPHE